MPQVERCDAGTQSLGYGRDTGIDDAEMHVAVLRTERVCAREARYPTYGSTPTAA